MKRIHLLRVEEEAVTFAPLVEAIRADGGRVGWLELDDVAVPDALAGAASLGVSKAVCAGSERTIAVKGRSGQPVVRDLLREHFLGCAAVLVAGEVEAPLLAADGDGWTVTGPAGSKSYSTDRLVRELRKPRPFR